MWGFETSCRPGSFHCQGQPLTFCSDPLSECCPRRYNVATVKAANVSGAPWIHTSVLIGKGRNVSSLLFSLELGFAVALLRRWRVRFVYSELYIEDCVKRLHLLPCSLTQEPDQDTNVLAHFSTQLRAAQAKLHSSHFAQPLPPQTSVPAGGRLCHGGIH